MMRKRFLFSLLVLGIMGTLWMGSTNAAPAREFGTITICDPDNSGSCITMIDRNLGATSNDITSTASYGYHYQWGNNHGFASCFVEGCTSFPNGESVGNFHEYISSDSSYDSDKYYVPKFCDGVPCSASEMNYVYGGGKNNLRGGIKDGRDYNRGLEDESTLSSKNDNRTKACPDGYHIPSAGEWSKAIEYWAKANGVTLNVNHNNGLKYITDFGGKYENFQSTFKLPLAGLRHYYLEDKATVAGIGMGTVLWSSSPYENNDTAYALILSQNGTNMMLTTDQTQDRIVGGSLRCFQNLSKEAPYKVSLYDENYDFITSFSVYYNIPRRAITNYNLTGRTQQGLGKWMIEGTNQTFDILNDSVSSDITLVLTFGERHTVSFVTNGGSSVSSQSIISGEKATEPSTTRPWHYFKGWYSDPDFQNEFDFSTPITEDITLYAKWASWEYNDVVICDPANSGSCVTMMDRNLGAESNDITKTESYGYHYQWGNGHGFASCLVEGCDTFPGGETKVYGRYSYSIWNYGPGYSWFDNPTFYYSYGDSEIDHTWYTDNNNNLWGGQNDRRGNNWGLEAKQELNYKQRQGPCPEGYHVPSIGEWNKALEYWAKANDVNLKKNINNGLYSIIDFNGKYNEFQSVFKIPFAGLRYYGAAVMAIGGGAGLWSSSTPGTDGTRTVAYNFLAMPNGAQSDTTQDRIIGESLRCFKDANQCYKVRMFDGDSEIWHNDVCVRYNISRDDIINKNLTGLTKEGLILSGWLVMGTNQVFDILNDSISSDLDLIADWTPAYTVTFNSNGGSSVPSQTIKDGGLAHRPTTPSKQLHSFDGWYTDKGLTNQFSFSTPITGDITLYAKWKISFEWNDISICDPNNPESCITIMDRNLGATSAGVGCKQYQCYENQSYYSSLEECLNNGSYEYCLGWKYYSNPSFSSRNDCENRRNSLYEQCFQSNTSVLGYHYQWGNNYGFQACTNFNGCDSFPGGETASYERINTNGYGPGNRFFGNIFRGREDKNWSSPSNNNLWGGKNDSASNNWGLEGIQPTNRQGPCPDGYHVPSIGEWNKLLEYWAGNNNIGLNINNSYGLKYVYINRDYNILKSFQSYFYIPFAGFRYESTKFDYYGGNLWSSTPTTDQNHSFEMSFYFGKEIQSSYSKMRTQALSVRCFKNPSEKHVRIWNGDQLIRSGNVYYNIPQGVITQYNLTSLTREGGYAFDGYTVSGTDKKFDIENDSVSSDIDLVADWEIANIVSFVTNGGTNVPQQKVKDGEYATEPNQPRRQGDFFEGWYTDRGLTERFNFHTPITGDITLYAKWTEFEREDIEICDTVGNCITMMDRNLGASKSGTNCDDNDNGACGYHFQWGNNHGFQLCTRNGCNSFPGGETTSETKVNTNGYGPRNRYNSNIFAGIANMDWSSSRNDNLWGGLGDALWNNRGIDLDNSADRQGPCPDGYHVPNAGEWSKALEYRTEQNNIELYNDGYGLKYINLNNGGRQFQSYFYIPFAGYRDEKANLNGLGGRAELWSSSPYNSESLRFYIGNSNSDFKNYYRTEALSIRCFKDPDFDPNAKISVKFVDGYRILYSGEVERGFIISQSGGFLSMISGYENKTGYTFNGWYELGIDVPYDFNNKVLSKLVLYGSWTANTTNGGNGGGSNGGGGGGGGGGSHGGNGGGGNGGGGSSIARPTVPEDDFEPDRSGYDSNYSDEMNEAYQYAHHYGITTMNSIGGANVDGNLTRIEMAKMLSMYAINILGMEPDESRSNTFKDVPLELNEKYNDGVNLAYQLGIMGINMPDNKFRPFDLVPRAEFVTVLSRMKYDTPDGEDVYYSTHMKLLNSLGIISNTDPKMLEVRGYVMLMLMRAK